MYILLLAIITAIISFWAIVSLFSAIKSKSGPHAAKRADRQADIPGHLIAAVSSVTTITVESTSFQSYSVQIPSNQEVIAEISNGK